MPFRFVPENEDYYVGLRFSFNGGTHYGWVRIHEGEAYEWAYESDADQPIQIAGAACAADWNNDGAANSQDFFDYLSAFFVMGLFLLFWLAYGDPIFGTYHAHH